MLVDGLVEEARCFTGGRGFADDLTILLLDTAERRPVDTLL
jgi:hypothetical protein